MKVTVEFLNYSYAKVDCENGVFMELRNYFCFDVDGARFNKKYLYSSWDGKIRLLESDGRLPIGLVGILEKYCAENDLEIEVDERLAPVHHMSREEFDTWLSGFEIYSGDTKITPHWYQADSVFEAINGNRRTLNLPTSAGKSLIACLLARWYLENYEGKVLILVPTTALVQQMIDDFNDYRLIPANMCHGIMSGTKKHTDRPVVVSTWQSACKMPSDWFDQFGFVNVDECHLATAKELGGIVQSMRDCQFKIGMSGSLRDGKANVLQYIGMFGHVFRPVTTRQLIDEGQVSDIRINSIFLRYQDHETVAVRALDYQGEIAFINGHVKRNAWICRLAIKLAKEKNENTLVLFKEKKHGKWLYEAIKAKYGEGAEDKVVYISGDTKTDSRIKMRSDVENDTGMIIVASFGVLSTGISIKRLHHAIFARPIKSKITVIQSVGRLLRKHATKDKAVLWDVIDDICVKPKTAKAKSKYVYQNFAYKHGLDRIDRYAGEQFEYVTKEVNL